MGRDGVRLETFRLGEIVTTPGHTGLHSTIIRDEMAVAFVKERVRRDNVVPKLYHQPLMFPDALKGYQWGLPYQREAERSKMADALTIQNLCAHHGLAPRVYDVGAWEEPDQGWHRPVAIVEDMGTEYDDAHDAYEVFKQCQALGDIYGFTLSDPGAPGRSEDYNVNAMNGRWVDFGGARWKEPKPQQETFIKRYIAATTFGTGPYQAPIGPLADSAVYLRDTTERLFSLELHEDYFMGVGRRNPTRVLDLGCNGGQFLNYFASRRGWNVRGLGIDHKRDLIDAAAEYSYRHGYWNIDYLQMDLNAPDIPSINKAAGGADLVLFLSVEQYIGGLVHWIGDVTAPGGRFVGEFHHQYKHGDVQAWLSAMGFKELDAFWSKRYGRLVIHAEKQ